jgi:acyl-CoA synthetase (NDP forming)
VLFAPQTENPVDIGGRLSRDIIETAGDIMRTLAADPDVSASLIVLGTMPFFTETTAALARAGVASGKPTLVAVTPGPAADAAREALRELGCPFTDWLDDGLRTLRIWTDCRRALEAPPAREPARPSIPPGAAEAVRHAPAGPLTEPEAEALFAAYEIPVNQGRVARTPDEAAAAACEVGFPVAVKAVSRRIVHKSDAGAVRLGLADEAEVRHAFQEVIAAARRREPSALIEGCLVQAIVPGEAELLAGVRRDPQFGPIVLVGSGGILAEVLRDVRMALAPVSADRAGEMLRGLRVWPVLDGARGRPALDVDAVAGIVSRLSWLAVDLGERLIDLEANPIVVRPAGRGAVVVDARGTLGKGRRNA